LSVFLRWFCVIVFMRLAFAFLFSALVSAAVIHGTVYDSSLEALDKAVVSVNSTPEQRLVAVNGSYSFELAPGYYGVTASYLFNGSAYSSSHAVRISGEGDYSVDLIIFSFSLPEFDTSFEEGLLGADSLDDDYPSTPATPDDYLPVFLGVAFVVGAALAIYYSRKPRPPKTAKKAKPAGQGKTRQAFVKPKGFYPSKSQRQILDALKNSEGFTTQKKLRKDLSHLSEARVSMDLTELEEHGFVKRFRRGRGNKVKLLS